MPRYRLAIVCSVKRATQKSRKLRTAGADGLHAQARAFSFHEVVDDEAAGDEVDLIGMMDKRA